MRKKIMSFVLALTLAGSLCACGGVTIDGEEKKEEKKTEKEASSDSGKIGFSVSTQDNPFFVDLAEGVEKEGKKEGKDVIVVDAGNDPAKQTSDIEDLVSKKISVLIVNPVDSDAAAPAVKDAMAAGIKVIALDRVVNGVDVDCAIASDNVEGAKMATEYLLEKVGKDGKVAELEGVPGASATVDRGKGFHEVADKNLDVVTSQTANFDRAEGMSVFENMLQAQPEIKGVFAHNDEMALGALQAAAGKKIVVVGFDATEDAVKAVQDGTMAATVAQQPVLMGETAVEMAVALMNGEEVAKDVPVEVELITEETAK